MKHFSKEEWVVYGKEPASEQAALMEKHLLDCDACLQLFLEGIDETDMTEALAFIPPDFTTHTSDLIRASARQEERPPARFQSKGLLAYYAAAAAITIMLTGGGVFEFLNNARINMPPNPAKETAGKYEEILFNWPSQLQEKTTGWFRNIELEKHKEVK
ncbi:MAG: hypothetical protein PHC92_11360 [Syntrophomonadaceae bacterium]|nr:hypothetical protein [Syntrophomonadaceae bacterium]MDD3023096.1 hypothetical protein [Syntrophomonadaceae bacterium]